MFGFTPYWDFKPTKTISSDSPAVYTSEKNSDSNTRTKIHLECDVIDVSVVNGLRQPVLDSFNLYKPAGEEVFCQPETVLYKKINNSVFHTIAF